MNLNHRRPTGTHNSPFDKVTKTVLLAHLEEHGYELNARKKNEGEWNELREFWAVPHDEDKDLMLLDVAMKGETRDWETMLKAFLESMN